MDKAVKPRRRRSIRNLRASTGFHSPPLPSVPYGSAWIDQDQETNMDNLVMSLSMLKCDQVNDDVDECVNSGFNQVDHAPSPHPAPHITECETAGAYSEKSYASEIDYGASELRAIPYDSFSFSPDMPLCTSHVENHQEAANDISQSYPLNTNSNTSFENFISNASCAVDCRQEIAQARSDVQMDPRINEHLERDSIEHLSPFTDQDLEEMYRELTLDFSPIPEEDHSFHRLVESIQSPRDVTPNTQKSSQNSSFEDSVIKVLSESQEASGIDSKLDEPPASESNIINKTFDIIRFTPRDDSLGNHPKSLSPESGFDDISNSPNESTNRVSETFSFNSENHFPQRLDTIIESMDNSHVVGSCESDHESGSADSFMPVVNEIETSYLTEGNGNSVRIQDALSNVIKTSSAYRAVDNCENLDLEAPILGDGIKVGKQNKRPKRRSSRKFQLQEFSLALCHSDDKTSEYVSIASDSKGKNLHSINILEYEKENLVCFDKEAGNENANDGDFSIGDITALSDYSNIQNFQRKKKTGRRSKSVTFLMKDCPPILKEVDGLLEDSSVSSDIPSKSVNVSNLGDITESESSLLDELSQERLQIHSNSVESIGEIEAEEENDPDPDPDSSVRKPKSGRNRKSWGNLSSHDTAPKSQGGRKSGKKESQSLDLQSSDLEQLYLQKKYMPVKPCNLETIKEVPAKGFLISKSKFKRFISFPEDYRPTSAKVKSRTKKTMKHFNRCLDLKTMDEEEFRSRMRDIMIDLETLELED